MPRTGNPPEAARWAVTYRRPGAPRLAWLLIEGVPATVTRAGLLEALETWQRWGAYAPGIGGTVTVAAEARWGELAGVAGAPRVSWAELAPAQRRVTVTVTGPVHAQLTRAARRRGVPLAAWASAVLERAAAAELEVVEHPTPANVSPGDTTRRTRSAKAPAATPAELEVVEPAAPAEHPTDTPARRTRSAKAPAAPAGSARRRQ